MNNQSSRLDLIIGYVASICVSQHAIVVWTQQRILSPGRSRGCGEWIYTAQHEALLFEISKSTKYTEQFYGNNYIKNIVGIFTRILFAVYSEGKNFDGACVLQVCCLKITNLLLQLKVHFL